MGASQDKQWVWAPFRNNAERQTLEQTEHWVSAAEGEPHARSGELPGAHLVKRAGAVFNPVALSEFAAVNSHERAANPVVIYQIDAIPVTAVGKPFKPALRADAAQRAESDTHT